MEEEKQDTVGDGREDLRESTRSKTRRESTGGPGPPEKRDFPSPSQGEGGEHSLSVLAG